MTNPDPPKELSGWAQIASYLSVTEPTARRYYRELGLPVDDRNGRYYAFTDKLDEWRRQRTEAPTRHDRSRPAGRSLRPFLPGRLAWVVAALVLTAVLATLLLPALTPAPAPSPHSVSIDGAHVTALDAGDEALWQQDAGELVPGAEKIDPASAVLADLDGDDRNEVVLTVAPLHIRAETSTLLALDHDGEVLWTFTNGDELNVRGRRFPWAYAGKPPAWLDLSPQPWILNMAHHSIWYPSQVTLLDPASGEPTLEYWHPGRIQSHTVTDRDGDAHPELYLGGINNPGHGIGHPSLSVLPIPGPGVEIATSSTFFRDDNPQEITYLLFPTYDVFEAQSLGAGVQVVQWQPDGRLLVGIGVKKNALVYQYLNADLEIEEMRPTDGFLQEHRRLHTQGFLDYPYSPEELDAWQRVVRFETLPDGNSQEVADLFATLQPPS